jgi:hypothetical protein
MSVNHRAPITALDYRAGRERAVLSAPGVSPTFRATVWRVDGLFQCFILMAATVRETPLKPHSSPLAATARAGAATCYSPTGPMDLHALALMFTFDDIMKTDDKGIQAILKDVDKDILALALKGAKPEMREKFLNNMSERAAKILREDMEVMGAVKIKDVDEAQMKIVTVAKTLADKGEIVIIGDGDGDGDEFIT